MPRACGEVALSELGTEDDEFHGIDGEEAGGRGFIIGGEAAAVAVQNRIGEVRLAWPEADGHPADVAHPRVGLGLFEVDDPDAAVVDDPVPGV
jgi:hypothetical protein